MACRTKNANEYSREACETRGVVGAAFPQHGWCEMRESDGAKAKGHGAVELWRPGCVRVQRCRGTKLQIPKT